MTRILHVAAALALTTSLALTSAPAAAAPSARFPDTIPLADGSRPEGIAQGPGTTFFAGAMSRGAATDGAVYRGDARTGSLSLLAEGRPGRAARGMMLDRSTGLLWVAGNDGAAATVTAYDIRDGDAVRRIVVPGERFLNDVQVTTDAVYVTDSRNAELVVVTADDVSLLPLTGDFVQPAGFGANGIRELPGGDLIIVSAGELFRVDPDSGVADRIELGGRDLEAGDGLERRGSTLYVVNGFDTDEVAVVTLRKGARTGTVTGAVGDPEALDRPTTAVLLAGSLYAVNGRFGTPPTPTTEYDVTRIALR